MDRPVYLTWLVEEEVVLDNGEYIKCYKLDYYIDDEILDKWALHIRRHYISDQDLEESCKLLQMTPADYLKKMIIPQKGENKLSGAARSNGLSEILFSDLLEFIYGLEVPRYRQYNMSGKTVSEHGTDIIGYEFYNSKKIPNKKDKLITMEVKAGLSSSSAEVIESAVVDANKDEFRLAQSLDYMRRKLKLLGKTAESNDVLRFQKKTEYDYILDNCAAGMSSLLEIEEKEINGKRIKVIPEIVGHDLRLKGNASIFYVHGKKLMELANAIYDRCIK